MTEIQKSYRGVLKGINGKSWKPDETTKIGDAGIAVAVSVLDDGIVKIQHLKKRIPDFTQSELRIALSRLRKNGYIVFHEGRYKLSVDKDTTIDDGIFWALMGAVANGWLRRK